MHRQNWCSSPGLVTLLSCEICLVGDVCERSWALLQDIVLGGEATYDSAKGQVTKWAAGVGAHA